MIEEYSENVSYRFLSIERTLHRYRTLNVFSVERTMSVSQIKRF